VTYSPLPDPIPLNQLFELEIRVASVHASTLPLSDLTVAVDAEMPEHRHGMNLRPVVTLVTPGRFRVQGMLFHMPGGWDIHVDVTTAVALERATFHVFVD
jgi:hypothetical protein